MREKNRQKSTDLFFCFFGGAAILSVISKSQGSLLWGTSNVGRIGNLCSSESFKNDQKWPMISDQLPKWKRSRDPVIFVSCVTHEIAPTLSPPSAPSCYMQSSLHWKLLYPERFDAPWAVQTKSSNGYKRIIPSSKINKNFMKCSWTCSWK